MKSETVFFCYFSSFILCMICIGTYIHTVATRISNEYHGVLGFEPPSFSSVFAQTWRGCRCRRWRSARFRREGGFRALAPIAAPRCRSWNFREIADDVIIHTDCHLKTFFSPASIFPNFEYLTYCQLSYYRKDILPSLFYSSDLLNSTYHVLGKLLG
jgi:hypothetical protein